jgi:cytoskeletal protein RodZ
MPTVGEILSAERRRQGKQISDVVEGTKIRSRLIDALEQGRYDDLPSPAYTKGYIQSYARFLEIPVEPLLDQFRVESAEVVRRPTPIDRYLAAIPAETVVPRRGTAHEIPRNVSIAAVVGVVLVVLLLCAISQLGSCGGPKTPAGSATSTETPGAPTVSGSPGATATTSTTTANLGFRLRISTQNGLASQVKLTVDGHPTLDETMQDGASKEFRVKERAVLIISNPTAVEVTRDGQVETVTANEPLTLTATN